MKQEKTAFLIPGRCSGNTVIMGVLALFVGTLGTLAYVLPSNAAPPDNRSISKQVPGSSVNIKIGKHQNYFRLVFEAPAMYIDKSSVMIAGSTDIKVVFPATVAFTLAGSKEGLNVGKGYVAPVGVRIIAHENSAVLTVSNLDDINVNKLLNPSRLVIDAFVKDTPVPVSEERPREVRPSEEFNAAPGTLVIDVGHGGPDIGLRAGGVSEKDFMLSFAKELAAGLGKRGNRVYLTRKSDQGLSISQRVMLVRKMKPSALISLHLSSGKGFAIYTAPAVAQGQAVDKRAEKAAVFAGKLRQRLGGQFGLEVRNTQLPLPLLTKTDTSAMMIELPSPEKLKYDRNTKKALLDALLEVFPYFPEAVPVEKQADTGGGADAK